MLRKCSFILLIVNEGINLIFLFYLPESPTTATMGDGCKLFVYGVDQNMSNEEIKVQFYQTRPYNSVLRIRNDLFWIQL